MTVDEKLGSFRESIIFTPMKLSMNIVYTYASQIWNVGCAFLCSILAARMLGQTGQGELALYTGFIALVSLLISVGLPSGFVHYIAARKLERPFCFPIMAMVIPIGMLLVAAFVFLFSNSIITQTLLPEPILIKTSWKILLLVHAGISILFGMLSALLQSEQAFKKNAITSVIGSTALLLMYSLYYFKWIPIPLGAFYWIQLSLLVVVSVHASLFLIQLHKIQPEYFQVKWPRSIHWKPLLFFSMLAFFTNLIQFFNYKMDIWFIHYFNQEKGQLGIYALGVLLTQMLWLLPNAVQTVVYAEYSQQTDQAFIWQRCRKASQWLFLYAVIGGLVLYFVAPYILAWFYGNEFVETLPILRILLWGIAPFSVTMTISAYFSGTHRVRVCLIASVIGFLVCLLADLWLIPSKGIIGAAYASVFSYLASTVYFVIEFIRDKKRIDVSH